MALTNYFENLIKPEMKEEFERDKHNWSPRKDTDENKAYDKRKPGLLKQNGPVIGWLLWVVKHTFADELRAVNFLQGAQKSRNKELLNENAFDRSLNKNEVISCQNKGFRFLDKSIKTYEQNKIALTPIYVKGVVMDDGVHVHPLSL